MPGTLALLIGQEEVWKVGQETQGCFSKECWKGSITWSTTRTLSLFVLIRVTLVIQQECVCDKAESEHGGIRRMVASDQMTRGWILSYDCLCFMHS